VSGQGAPVVSRRMLALGGAAIGLAACTVAKPQVSGGASSGDPLLVDLDRQPDEEIVLWPDGAPGIAGVSLNEHYVHRDNPFGLVDRAAHEVTRPSLQLFRSKRASQGALLIIPGGGYGWVVVEKEGYEGARYFSRGHIDVYVLKYRLPHQGWAAGPDAPLQDAQRAMRVIRARTSGKAAVMGFSAGGHLAGLLCQQSGRQTYAAVDAADALSAAPDLSVLVYPVIRMSGAHVHSGSRDRMIGPSPDAGRVAAFDLAAAPPATTPPTFLLHALDDQAVPVENSLDLAQACRRAGVPCVLHTFETGGHGFGLRGITGTPTAAWPQLVADWIKARGFVFGLPA
jgi:acetyl esterase/lipase